uniref:Carboxylic ester hydrolase n=1 Tax=Rhipicephalus appendiculatus TaxID=34631 RepID=A0A131YKF0_RHIAP
MLLALRTRRDRWTTFTPTGAFLLTLLTSSALSDDSVVITTEEGKVRGRCESVVGRDVDIFLGIPYAAPPVGELRFLKPQPVSPWKGVYDATTVKDSCMQPRVPWVFDIPTALSEDCLHLNVWTPQASESTKLPVVVWFYGGIFKLGSAYETRYNAAPLAALNDVVVVSCNFRSGMFGFLDANNEAAPGNVGLWDQVMVMEWVQRNIRAFGGDPELVTLFGESSGAMDIHLHLLSPFSAGLFRRAFFMSGTESTDVDVNSVYESIQIGNAVAEALGCANPFQDLTTHPDEVLKCLRKSSASDIAEATENVTSPIVLAFLPTFNTEFVPYLPSIATEKGRFRVVEAMVSVVENEGAFAFVMQPDKELLEDDLSGYEWEEFVPAVEAVVGAFVKKRIFPIAHGYLENSQAKDKAAFRQQAADFVGKNHFYCPSRVFAENVSARNGKAYGMVFAHRSQKSTLPQWTEVVHMQEIPYFFGIPFLDSVNYDEEDREVSAEAMRMLTSFARDGKPSDPNGTQWTPFSAEEPHFLWLEPGNYGMTEFYDGDACDIWRKFECPGRPT